jgi:hypothetical protein
MLATLFWEQGGSNTAGQLSQTVGNMLTPSSVGAFWTNGTTAQTIAGGASAAYTVGTTNTVRIATERMSGVVLKAAYTMSNQNRNQTGLTGNNAGYTGGTSDQSGYQVAFDWNIQKANIQASYASFQSVNPYDMTGTQAGQGGMTIPAIAATSTSGFPATWGTGLQGQNITDNQTLVTASYDFGILKAFVGWTDRKATSAINTNAYAKRTAQEIGVRGYATKTIEYWGSVGNGRWSTAGANVPTANIFGFQAGSNYWMSKRTNLYAIYGQTGTSSTSLSPSYNINQYSLGVRHTF